MRTRHAKTRKATRAAVSAPEAALSGRDLKVRFGDAEILPGTTLSIPRGSVTAIVGPNGSGKSTALKALARLIKPQAGSVLLAGRDIARLSTREVARHLAILPQSPEAPAGVTVRDLVGYGRYPHRGPLAPKTDDDEAAISWALDVTGTTRFADREVQTLSGGERQRACIAMALAQRTDVLLLDEPTSYLDVRYQVDVLNLVRRLNREHGITVCWVLHDLNQAAEYSDHVIVLKEGRLLLEGTPHAVMTRETIAEAFDVDVVVVPHPITGAPLCVPTGACDITPDAEDAVEPAPAHPLTTSRTASVKTA